MNQSAESGLILRFDLDIGFCVWKLFLEKYIEIILGKLNGFCVGFCVGIVFRKMCWDPQVLYYYCVLNEWRHPPCFDTL